MCICVYPVCFFVSLLVSLAVIFVSNFPFFLIGSRSH